MPIPDNAHTRETLARWSIEQAIQASNLSDDAKSILATAEGIYEFVEKKGKGES